jgi:muconolactone delta-isomerase
MLNEEILLKFCEGVQVDNIKAYFAHDCNAAAAARALGKTRKSVANSVNRANKRAADKGYIDTFPDLKIAEGRKLGKVTTQVNSKGEIKNVWYRQDDYHQQSLLAIEEYCKELPKIISKAPLNLSNQSKDVIPWFNIGDCHLGMLSYHNEVNDSFDLSIGERDLCAAIGMLIDESMNCERCVIQDMGDMTHYENVAGVTDASGHDLDCDGRFPKMIMTYVRVMRFIMDKALSKFKYVDVIINQGNHSRTNDFWMRTLLFNLYENDDRVNVLDNQNIFIPYRMGNTFVMSHHSDKCKPKKLADVMTTDYRQDFGETEYHYIDIGHIHHSMQLKEHPGITIESFNQLATKDAYAHEGGWRSRSCLTVVYRSKTYGEIGRQKISLERVRDILNNVPAGTNSQKRPKVYSV